MTAPPNAPQLHENIRAFEKLLAHNPKAKIVWAHAGTDGTGERTAALCRRLLQAHRNLFMELKLDGSAAPNSPLVDGAVDPDWLKLFQDFPDRFIIGSDQHYPQPSTLQQRWEAPVALLNQLPLELQKSIGTNNAMHIYKVGK